MKLLFAALLLAQVGFASADYTLIQDILGKYYVTAVDSDFSVSGSAEIFASEEGVGIHLRQIELSSHPITNQDLVTAKEPTILNKVGNHITQDFKTNNISMSIDYAIYAGYLSATVQRCDGTDCSTQVYTLSKNQAEGTPISAKDFFASIEGDYDVSLSAGHEPKPDNRFAGAGIDGEDGYVRFPYCHPGIEICDEGSRFLPLSTTTVNKLEVGENHTVYTIGSEWGLYRWDNNNGQVTFRDYQYRLPTGTPVVLEFVAARRASN